MPARWERAGLAGLFVAGLLAWGYVIGWGSARLDFHDWADINAPRLAFVQNALRAGEWPLHMADRASLHDVTDRFLTLPDVITTPQMLLLAFVPVPAFILFDVLLHYSIGFAGLLLLRRHFHWSLPAFAGVYLLFLFNGHILAHYSVGHFTWGPYFLFPFICLFLVRFLDGDRSWTLASWFAAVMFYMALAGGQHHFTWVLLLLGLLIPFCWRDAWWLVAAGVSSVLLSAVRLLPPALELQSFRRAGLISDVIGYPSVAHLVESLAWLRRETPAFNMQMPGNMWFFDSSFYEFNVYVGVAGLALIVYGAYLWLREARPRYPELIVPLLAMTAFSIGSVYRLVRALHIPLFDSERYTARMFSLPLTFVIVLAATAIDKRLREIGAHTWHRAFAMMALLFVAIDIGGSIRLWRVVISSGLFAGAAMGVVPATINGDVAHRSDPAYTQIVLAGLAISVATGCVLAVMARRDRLRGVTAADTIDGL